MKKWRAIAIAGMGCSIVAGCATHFHKTMDKDMRGLVGKDIGTVVKKLGYPSIKLTVAGDTDYWWEQSGCTIHFGTDASDHIVRFDYSGSRGDCEKYYDALDADTNSPPATKVARH